MKQFFKRILQPTPAYDLARSVYQSVFNPRALGSKDPLSAWYSAFVQPGDLVFDVGANHGDHSAALLRLGARVIAVEPNPKCAGILRGRFRNRTLTVEQAAVGAERGEATLHIADSDTLSTLSDDWLDRCKSKGRFQKMSWDQECVVSVTTLDDMYEKYGFPSFVKVDVEGFEDKVLMGASRVPPSICFEFNSEAIDVAKFCVRRLSELGSTAFCLRTGIGSADGPQQWDRLAETEARLNSIAAGDRASFGDIFAVSQDR